MKPACVPATQHGSPASQTTVDSLPATRGEHTVCDCTVCVSAGGAAVARAFRDGPSTSTLKLNPV